MPNTVKTIDDLPKFIEGTNCTHYTLKIDRPKSNGYKWRMYYSAPSYGKKYLVEASTFEDALNLLEAETSKIAKEAGLLL
jgi:hypothetical protein